MANLITTFGANLVAKRKDKEETRLDGRNTYRLNVPANAPVTLYWSATAYDRCFCPKGIGRQMRAVGYDGVLCPDHVPTSDVDPGRERFFSFCLGYTQALLQAA